MNVLLCDTLLNRYGYRSAFGWWCLERFIVLAGGEGNKDRLSIDRVNWTRRELLMPWTDFVAVLPDLVRAGRLQSFETTRADVIDLILTSHESPPTLAWEVSKAAISNLKQHGLVEREIRSWAREFDASSCNASDIDGSFVKWALRRHYQQSGGDKPLVIDKHWTPSESTLEVLSSKQIPAVFIEDRLPEYWLYWKDVGVPRASYQSTFISYIEECWSNELSKDCKVDEWQPSEQLFNHANISLGDRAAAELLGRFRLYWRDQGKQYPSERWELLFSEYIVKTESFAD